MSDLSKPVAWKLHHHDRYYFEENADVVAIAESMGQAKGDAVYSQEYVSALPAENERVASDLVARNGEIEGLKKRAAELEAKLATPVRLLGEMLVHDWDRRVERQAAFEHRKIAWDARLAEDKKAILAAGFTFTVEGDE